MNRPFIDQFFAELDRELGDRAEIILTGAAAGSLWGQIRPSLDIDFEIRFPDSKKSFSPSEVSEAIQRASAKIGTAVNYSEDISRWSMIDYLDYRKAALPYKTIGRLRIKLMAPGHWTIGKMARFFEIDIEDLLKVIRLKKLKPGPLIKLWGEALRESPLSGVSGQFRDHVISFLKEYGKSLWGRRFNAEESIALFKRAAKIQSSGE